MKRSSSLRAMMATALASAALLSATCTAATAAPVSGDVESAAAAPSTTRVLESGLTEKQAYDNSVAILDASRRELANSKLASSTNAPSLTPQAAAADSAWPKYFTEKGLEPISCVVVADLASCNTAKNLAQAALNLAYARYPTSVQDGKGDAFRHAYWNATMYINIGPSAAERIAGNHEALAVNNTKQQKAMDLYNNAKGRNAGIGRTTTAAVDKEVTRLANTPKNMGGLQISL